MTQHITDIAADSKHATGGELSFPGGAPITRLEIVVRIGKGGPATHRKPGISFVRVMPSTFDPSWAGEIDGEVQNDDPAKTIQFVELSGVVLDAAGNILGGGTGFGVATLPPASRMAMKISGSFDPIPYAHAAGHARPHEADPENLTWVGRRVLKPWYVDEVPQLLNVLRGDISLVGPRPWPPELVEAQAAAGFAYRNEIAAGLTGPAQVTKG